MAFPIFKPLFHQLTRSLSTPALGSVPVRGLWFERGALNSFISKLSISIVVITRESDDIALPFQAFFYLGAE
jgi:hypothetical protein